MPRRGFVGIAIICGFGPLLAAESHAQVLTNYNLVVIGDRSGSSEVEGRVFVGGNLSGTLANAGFNGGNVGNNSPVDTLTVLGNLSAHGSIQSGRIDLGKTGTYGGGLSNNTGNNGMNGALPLIDTTTPAPSLAAVKKELLADSASFAALATTGTIEAPSNFNGGKLILHGNPGLAVFSLTASQLFSGTDQIQLKAQGATEIVVNVTGANVTDNLSMDSVFQGLRSKVLFNFEDAMSLTLNSQFFGAVLAPKADLHANADIDGGAFVKQFEQNNEVHLSSNNPTLYYSGLDPASSPTHAVPEPSTIAMTGIAGLCGMAVAWSRRRKAKGMTSAA